MAQAARRRAQPRAPPPAQRSSARGPSAQAAGPARLVLLAVLTGALLGGCGLVVTLAAHASAADAGRSAGPGARGALLPGAQPRRVAAEDAPGGAASAAAAGRPSGPPGSRGVQAGRRAERAEASLAAGAGAAAAEPGLPANRAQALLPAARLEESEVEVEHGATEAAGAASAAEPGELPANRAQALLQPAAVRAAGAGAAGRAEVPDSHARPVGRARAAAKRAASAQAAGGAAGARRGGQRRSGAYVALCAIMKDQNADVREWVAHHAGLGVGKIYITDSGSARPLGREIADYIASGLVDYFYSDNLVETTDYPQLYVYDVCLERFGGRHEWMGFIDADEFLVLTGGALSLPELLRGYEDFAALGVNMRTFGSSGHLRRPEGSTLHNYVKCTDGDDEHTRHIKTIARTRGGRVLSALTPHSFEYAEGAYAVNERREPIDDYLTDEASWDEIVLNHYVLKSREEFRAKVARSNGMNDPKPSSYFDEIDALATEDCTYAAELYPADWD